MNKKVVWLIVGLAAVTIILFFIAFRGSASAHECDKWCDPTPTTKPTTIPTPTIKLCFTGDEEVPHPCPSPTPTVTPVATPSAAPTATPSATPQGGSSGSDGANQPPPIAQCGTTFDAPVIVSFTDKRNGTVNFAWTEGQTVDKYSITYGYTADSLNMGEDNIPGNVTNWDIHQLNPGNHVYAQVQAWFRGCEESSNVFDPIVR